MDNLKNQLIIHFMNVQHVTSHVRQEAEICLGSLFETNLDSTVQSCMSIASDESVAIYLRQLSILLVNQKIKRKMNDLSTESKSLVLSFGFQFLHSASVAIRNGCLNLISKIAVTTSRFDFQIFIGQDKLSGLINSGNICHMTLSLRLLSDIGVEVDGDVERLVEILKLYFNRIHALFTHEFTNYRDCAKLLKYGAKVITVCVHGISMARMVGGLDENDINEVSQSFFIPWCSTAVAWMRHNRNNFESILTSELEIYLEILKSLKEIYEGFVDECYETLGTCLQCAWELLSGTKNSFVAHFIQIDNPIFSDGYTSDGDRLDIEVLVVHSFELFCISLGSAQSDIQQFAFEGTSLDSLMEIICQFMQLLPLNRSHYYNDGNEFICFEEDDSFELSLRHTGAELLQTICKSTGDRALRSLFSLAQSELNRLFYYLQPQSQQSSSMNSNDILFFESIMWGLGSVGKVYRRFLNKSSQCSTAAKSSLSRNKTTRLQFFDDIIAQLPPNQVLSFLENCLSFATQLPTPHITLFLPRVLWVLSVYNDLFQQVSAGGFNLQLLTLNHSGYIINSRCLDRIHSDAYPLGGWFLACRAFGSIIKRTESNDLIFEGTPSQLGLCCIQATFASLNVLNETNENTAHIILETLLVIIKACFPILSCDLLSQVTVAILGLLIKYHHDAMILHLCQDVLMTIIKLPNEMGLRVMYHHYFPNLSHYSSLVASNVGFGGPQSVMFWQICFEILGDLSSQDITGSQVISQADSYGLKSSALLLTIKFSQQTFLRGTVGSYFSVMNKILSGTYSDCIKANIWQSNLLERQFLIDFTDTSMIFVEQLISDYEIELQKLKIDQISELSEHRVLEYIGPVMGFFAQVMLQFNPFITFEIQLRILGRALNCMIMTSSKFIEYTIIMTLIHLVAHNSLLITRLLSALQSQTMLNRVTSQLETPFENIYVQLLTIWCGIHSTFISRYCGKVSALGLIELIKLFNQQETNYAFASYLMKILLGSLPNLLIDGENRDDGKEVKKNDDTSSVNFNDDDGDSSDCSIESHEEGSLYAEDDDEDMNESDVNLSSPFAPAELYYLRDTQTGGDDLDNNNLQSIVTNISDTLMFSPHGRDPLADIDLQAVMIETLSEFCGSNRNETSFPCWFEQLSVDDVGLIKALLAAD